MTDELTPSILIEKFLEYFKFKNPKVVISIRSPIPTFEAYDLKIDEMEMFAKVRGFIYVTIKANLTWPNKEAELLEDACFVFEKKKNKINYYTADVGQIHIIDTTNWENNIDNIVEVLSYCLRDAMKFLEKVTEK